MNEKLKVWRKSRQITQKQAARILTVKLRTYQQWEQGVRQPRSLARTAVLRVIHQHDDWA